MKTVIYTRPTITIHWATDDDISEANVFTCILRIWLFGGTAGNSNQKSESNPSKSTRQLSSDMGGSAFPFSPNSWISDYNVMPVNIAKYVVVFVAGKRIQAIMLMIKQQPRRINLTRQYCNPADGVVVVCEFLDCLFSLNVKHNMNKRQYSHRSSSTQFYPESFPRGLWMEKKGELYTFINHMQLNSKRG
jgi:hypothetical protein